jgi:hypothetical protein
MTDGDGALAPIDGLPGDVRRATASNGRIVAEAMDGQFLVSDPPAAGQARSWRAITVPAAPLATPTGLDLSLDGKVLAIAMGDPATPRLELLSIDVDSGTSTTRTIELAANGPPSWLGPDSLALEVIRPDQHAGIATFNLGTGEVAVTDARGIEPSATRDGSRLAVASSPSGLVITDPATWLGGGPVDGPSIEPPADSAAEGVALDADGTRLAVVYRAASGAASVVMLRLVGSAWESVSTTPIDGDAAISIDWLE